jgi:hypothetical protein
MMVMSRWLGCSSSVGAPPLGVRLRDANLEGTGVGACIICGDATASPTNEALKDSSLGTT